MGHTIQANETMGHYSFQALQGVGATLICGDKVTYLEYNYKLICLREMDLWLHKPCVVD